MSKLIFILVFILVFQVKVKENEKYCFANQVK